MVAGRASLKKAGRAGRKPKLSAVQLRRVEQGLQRGPEALSKIHGWLIETGRLGFIPVPLRSLDDRTIQRHAGRLWEVAPWMPGAADLGRREQ